MKHLRLMLAGLPVLLLAGCEGYGDPDNVVLTTPPPQQFEPIVMNRDEFEAAVQVMPEQAITKAGKIYIKNGLLFINDVRKGFHVYNYTDPANPVPMGFINIPGSTDLAMRAHVIYINQATDLVVMSYSEDGTITLVGRNRDVFPSMPSPDGTIDNVADDEVIIGWEQI
ncbi:hypothetical protein OGH69_16240 [Flavobacterium sp. MFBS3-15]|uniref:hypothetical protein n=1 Tax=Flavobacterium sp. MFBS3-15 TaxID=2989816 RepID=UPI00223689D2|nr:hypothetical protein [Flavobacterium sp. MFBS3-15]MCW4470522.1 hypothetical protein [Flavobacterium sp. MFBS3-15]